MFAHNIHVHVHVRIPFIMQEPLEYQRNGYSPMPLPVFNSYRPPGLARKLKEGALVSKTQSSCIIIMLAQK